jgi:hypothetical protein
MKERFLMSEKEATPFRKQTKPTFTWHLGPSETIQVTCTQAPCHPAIWVHIHAAKWPCRRIRSVCWGQQSQYGTSKQLSTLRFIRLWLRGRDMANLGWIKFKTEKSASLAPNDWLGTRVNHLTDYPLCTGLSSQKTHDAFLVNGFPRCLTTFCDTDQIFEKKNSLHKSQ